MRKFALYAAVAATAMAGMGTMTSQASVKAYVIGGNYGGNCSNGMSVGNGNSLNEILQMVTSGGAGSGLLAPTLPGTLDPRFRKLGECAEAGRQRFLELSRTAGLLRLLELPHRSRLFWRNKLSGEPESRKPEPR